MTIVEGIWVYRSLVLLTWVESLDSGIVCQFFCVEGTKRFG